VGLYKLNAADPSLECHLVTTLEPTCIKRKPVSKTCFFKFNVYRYAVAARHRPRRRGRHGGGRRHHARGGARWGGEEPNLESHSRAESSFCLLTTLLTHHSALTYPSFHHEEQKRFPNFQNFHLSSSNRIDSRLVTLRLGGADSWRTDKVKWAAKNGAYAVAVVGPLYKLNPVDPRLESARFQPLRL
jgi:hypothetical protein